MGGRKNRELVGKRNPRAQRWGRDLAKQPSHRVGDLQKWNGGVF